jgi:hypothetical protein
MLDGVLTEQISMAHADPSSPCSIAITDRELHSSSFKARSCISGNNFYFEVTPQINALVKPCALLTLFARCHDFVADTADFFDNIWR